MFAISDRTTAPRVTRRCVSVVKRVDANDVNVAAIAQVTHAYVAGLANANRIAVT